MVDALEKFYVSSGVNIETKRRDRGILHAARYGSLGTVTALIEHRASLEVCLNECYYPIHLAAIYNTADIISKLIESGADIFKIDRKGKSDAFSLSERNKEHGRAVREVLCKALCSGVNIEKKRFCGYTGISYAARYGTLETISALIEQKANIEVCTNSGKYPIHLAARYNSADVIYKLIDSGADIFKLDRRYRGSFSLAEDNKEHGTAVREVLCKALLSVKNLQTTDNWGRTALHYAAKWGKLEEVSELINRGANINVCTASSNSPLHLASLWNTPDIVSKLIEVGADSHKKNKLGEDAFKCAKKNDKHGKAVLEVLSYPDVQIRNRLRTCAVQAKPEEKTQEEVVEKKLPEAIDRLKNPDYPLPKKKDHKPRRVASEEERAKFAEEMRKTRGGLDLK